MNKKIVPLLGCDPEVFIKHIPSGNFVSAHGMFPGTKEEPFPLGNYGFVQVDGHALEFNTTPAETEDEFVFNVQTTFGLVKDMVKEVNEDFEIALEPVAEFDPLYFSTLPVESKVLGCTPDYSGLTGEVLAAPEIGEKPLRTSSGHIHIGWTKFDDPFEEVKFKERLELANRITPHLLNAAKAWETPSSKVRRQYYGRDFSFRPKSYGVELRALDCLWLKSEETIRAVYRATINAFEEEFHYAG